jgi:hypothetical protein
VPGHFSLIDSHSAHRGEDRVITHWSFLGSSSRKDKLAAARERTGRPAVLRNVMRSLVYTVAYKGRVTGQW